VSGVSFYVGVDLGQSTDYTAVAVVEEAKEMGPRGLVLALRADVVTLAPSSTRVYRALQHLKGGGSPW
jgi:hypothetical protein